MGKGCHSSWARSVQSKASNPVASWFKLHHQSVLVSCLQMRYSRGDESLSCEKPRPKQTPRHQDLETTWNQQLENALVDLHLLVCYFDPRRAIRLPLLSPLHCNNSPHASASKLQMAVHPQPFQELCSLVWLMIWEAGEKAPRRELPSITVCKQGVTVFSKTLYTEFHQALSATHTHGRSTYNNLSWD